MEQSDSGPPPSDSKTPVRSPFTSTIAVARSGPVEESADFGLAETIPEPPLPAAFGRYRVNSVLARGGMGIIYHCSDPAYKRNVALKALLPEHADKLDYLRRFHSEVQVTSHLEHP